MKVLYITRFTYAQGDTFYCSEISNYLFYKFLLVSCENYDFKLMGFLFFFSSGQNCKVFTTPLSRNSQKRLEDKENQTKYRKMTRKPLSHVRILIYRTWERVIRELKQPRRRPQRRLQTTPKLYAKLVMKKNSCQQFKAGIISYLQHISVKWSHLPAGILNCVRCISFQRPK